MENVKVYYKGIKPHSDSEATVYIRIVANRTYSLISNGIL